MEGQAIDLFPVNGLDRSLHAPVLVGLLFLTFFAETLGWTYAGLVVPGYFAAVLVAAPATAVLVMIEAVLTYAISALLGRWLPRAGVWSTAFGRERFFLLIVVGLGVRLALEANLLPLLENRFQLPHSRELHSLGLVLVPLLANMFWNAGFVASFPRVVLLSGLTYLVLDGLLLRYTNFTISRFEVANESVSLAFLEAPHAQFILLIGALLAARANVLYGWDYNGILVPALLSVAWYQPTKLLTTVIEALVVYGCARGVAALPPLSNVLIVGTRRTLLAFLVGFALKWIFGMAMMRIDPSVHMIDFLGFGYLLPTLLAVKMWNRNAIGTVIVPTVQVSAAAFLVGNLAGYALASWDRATVAQAQPVSLPTAERSAAFELMLGHTAPAPGVADADVAARTRLVQEAIDRLTSSRAFDEGQVERAAQLDMRLLHTRDATGEHLVIRPRSSDPNADRAAPRVAVRLDPEAATPWLIVAVVDRVGSPVIAAATELSRLLDARAVVLQSTAGVTADYDAALTKALAEQLRTRHVLRVVVGANAELEAVGELPPALDVHALGELVGTPVQLRWRAHRAAASPLVNAPTLRLPPRAAERAALRVLAAPDTMRWPGGIVAGLDDRLERLTSVRPFDFATPSIEELRLFRARIAPAFRALDAHGQPGAWERALAGQLRYRFVRIGTPATGTEGWALIEPASQRRRGNATWIRRTREPAGNRDSPGVLIEAPAVRWEIGTFRASVMMLGGLRADGLLITGALPNAALHGRADMRTKAGVRSFYHVIHQSWLDAGGRALAVHGIAPEREVGHDVVLSVGKELADEGALPAWTGPAARFFTGNGLDPAVVDGSLELAPFEGGHDPAVGYANRFAADRMLLVWISSPVRRHLVSMQEDETTSRRLALAGTGVVSADARSHVLRLLRCFDRGRRAAPDCPSRPRTRGCELDETRATFEAYTRTRNPHALNAALAAAEACHLELIEDRESHLLWAVLADHERGALVPLRGGPAERAPYACDDASSLRLLLSTGLASASLRGGP